MSSNRTWVIRVNSARRLEASISAWSTFLTLTLLVPCLLTLGCQRQVAVVTYDEENWEGTVDESLPDDLQAGQRAIIQLFKVIQEDGFDGVSSGLSNIRFEETFEEFFGQMVDLYRWDWDGAPKGDQFPVKLILREDEGVPGVEHRRTYRVRKSGRGFVISRVRPES